MNGREAVYSAIHSPTPPSFLPAGPFAGYYAAEVAGISLRDYITSGARIAEGQLLLQEKIHHDILVVAADTYYIAQGFGLKIELHEDALPTALGPLLTSLKDGERLKALDPGTDGRMPVYLDAVRILRDKVGNDLSVRGTGTGPFSLAGYLLGIDTFLMKLMDLESGEGTEDEDKHLHKLMETMTATSLKFLSAQIDAGADILYLGDSLASLNMISPALYRKYVFPYHRYIFRALKSQIAGREISTMIHICGNNMGILSDIVETGVDLIEIDSMMDLSEVKRILNGRAAAIGNLDPVSVLKDGSAAEVEDAADSAIEKGAPGGRFILGSGCFVCPGTPQENLRAMVGRAHLSSVS